MSKRSEGWMVSYCGLNCAKCDIYEAGHGNEKKRDEILTWFREKRNIQLKPEQVACEGCKGPLDAHWSEDCRMMLCARRKELQYCFQCVDFPCTMVEEFAADGASHHKRTVENAKRMKEMGIEQWIIEQNRKGQCTFCP